MDVFRWFLIKLPAFIHFNSEIDENIQLSKGHRYQLPVVI